jgi:CheY-like chemotaxis protein
MKKYILYAEDDTDDYELLKTALSELNPDIELVHLPNGYDLIGFLQDCQPDSYPSLILLDMKMPLLSGTKTLEYLKMDDHFRNIPVVCISSASSPADRELIRQKGSEIMTKPFVYDEWLQIARRLASYCCFLLIYTMIR